MLLILTVNWLDCFSDLYLWTGLIVFLLSTSIQLPFPLVGRPDLWPPETRQIGGHGGLRSGRPTERLTDTSQLASSVPVLYCEAILHTRSELHMPSGILHIAARRYFIPIMDWAAQAAQSIIGQSLYCSITKHSKMSPSLRSLYLATDMPHSKFAWTSLTESLKRCRLPSSPV